MKRSLRLLPLSLSLMLVSSIVWAETYPTTPMILENSTAALINHVEEDDVEAKLDPLTTAFIIEVGVPLASSLFNKVLNWFSKEKPSETQQATQDRPLLASTTVFAQNILKNQCYAYVDRKVALNKEKYQELATQFGGLCEFLAPNTNENSNLQFPTHQPTYTDAQNTKPLEVQLLQGYGVNYQGLQLQIEMLDKKNNVIEIRPAQADFKSGERFRLKVTPTFTGLLQIQHQGTNGETEILFPRLPIKYFQLNAGQSLTIPTDPKRYYYFDDKKGMENLMVQFADYQGMKGQYSNKVIYRQDDAKSTYLMQEVNASQHAFILQTISMHHK